MNGTALGSHACLRGLRAALKMQIMQEGSLRAARSHDQADRYARDRGLRLRASGRGEVSHHVWRCPYAYIGRMLDIDEVHDAKPLIGLALPSGIEPLSPP